jgi:hypothetical protein
MTTWPLEPLGLVIDPRLVTGPLQRISKLHLASTDGGVKNRKRALGLLKKSRTFRSVADIWALPAPNWTSRESGDDRAAVQNRPLG